MVKVRLIILGQSLEAKWLLDQETPSISPKYENAPAKDKGEYGGKGEFELPKDHKAFMPVTKGGSSCKNCKYVDIEKNGCMNKHYVKWNGDNKLPNVPLDEICSDWWEPKK